ncbi:alpha/beta fold hydrolase [Undibacterium sp. TJN19]|uniref:alpha/beta fold hydrolase n=1 Tax=Undibacterium sp. TJN19 TaxID=3413055 RepID=UPI003BF061A6
MPNSTLFLHGGPGLSSVAERTWINEQLDIAWWEQPRSSGPHAISYDIVLEAAASELHRHFVALGKPIRLLANSFGCRLALDLATLAPQQLHSMVLLAPTFDLPISYHRFARLLMKKAPTAILESALQAYESEPAPACFWSLIGAILQVPRFTDYYWSPDAKSHSERFAELMSSPAGFDFRTFQQVLDSLLARGALPLPCPFPGPVTAIFGSFDPYLDLAEDTESLHRLLKNAHIQVVESGHFPHLELASQHWLPAIDGVCVSTNGL